jgi:redox-sensitive bicupin YhaK (pirin superfamily)
MTKPYVAVEKPAVRKIVKRTTGIQQGPVRRLISPEDLGEMIKPFVLLDLVEADATMPQSFGLHPHSGIATFSILLEGAVWLNGINGDSVMISAGGAEWMNAGSGVWHAGATSRVGKVSGYQLWVSLPPDTEMSEPYEQFIAREEIPASGPARILIGSLAMQKSPVSTPLFLNVLDVRLYAGQCWTYTPPQGHDVLWSVVHSGLVTAGEQMAKGECVVFEQSEGTVEFVASTASRLIIGSAAKSPYKLAIGKHSVHTNPDALFLGEKNIERLKPVK